MAASGNGFENWRNLLNKHPVCKYLREKISFGASRHLGKDSKSFICIHSSDLFIWSSSDACILHCNLKALALSENAEIESRNDRLTISGAAGSGVENGSFQKLVPVDVLSLDIERISINTFGSHILLWGSRGVRIVELPRRWGKNAVFEGGKETITCRTKSICEKALLRSSSLKVLQVSWHPNADNQYTQFVAVLTSDNRFSVYDLWGEDEPRSSTLISPGDATLDASPSKSFVGAALGEVAVAFDFGVPIMLQGKPKPQRDEARDCGTLDRSIQAWPVYCVFGNGTVMLLYSHIAAIGRVTLPVQGPLAMYPPADDNYGVDACSILCLPTAIPVIVVSTCEGRLHHCVQLPGVAEEDFSQTEYFGGSLVGGFKMPTEPILYVVETAVLELCLTGNDVEDLSSAPEEEEFMCPVMLRKDSNSPDRYHCCHAAGVHSVALPWLTNVQEFFLAENSDFDMPEEECVVEHVLCTKPLYSCPTSPVLGMDVVTDPQLGATLVILSSDLEFTILPIGLQYQVTSPCKDFGASSGSGGSQDDATTSESRTGSGRESFKKKLEQILQRKTSVPILKSDPTTELSQQTMFEILSRVTSLLREEYIHKQDQARHELQTRISVLQQRKEHQLQDVAQLLAQRDQLRENAEAISEKLEGSKENHEVLLRRLESVLRKIHSRVPLLSEAERQEMKELNAIKGNMDLFTQNIEQVRVKQEYQQRQMQRGGGGNSPALRQRQLTQIKAILQDESNDIEELKKDVTRLNIGLS